LQGQPCMGRQRGDAALRTLVAPGSRPLHRLRS
jgi:hypothetical protein